MCVRPLRHENRQRGWRLRVHRRHGLRGQFAVAERRTQSAELCGAHKRYDVQLVRAKHRRYDLDQGGRGEYQGGPGAEAGTHQVRDGEGYAGTAGRTDRRHGLRRLRYGSRRQATQEQQAAGSTSGRVD